MLVRPSPKGYSDVTEGNIFYYCQLPHAVFVLLHGQPRNLDDLLIYFRVTFYLSLRYMFNMRCFAVDDLLIY